MDPWNVFHVPHFQSVNLPQKRSMPPSSLYWYDYETFGIDPRRDRPAQFAGLRTDPDFNPVSPPLVLYCKPPRDYLPNPEACLLTGIIPQIALQKGMPEAEFIAAIHAEFSVPGTCVLGYNNLRFDDEVTRNTLYRNLFDPYAREWQNGNSRWDLIDLVRLARALRPEGIVWPRDDAGKATIRLEALTAANGIAHADAHDALSDVRATIELARLLKQRQPRLYDYAFTHRGKRAVQELLGLGKMEPVLHVSEKIPGDRHSLAVVVALAWNPRNPNGIAVYDLAVNPEPLLTLAPEELRKRLYTPVAELPEGVERLPLKNVHINKCPVLAPLKTLRPADAERLGVNLDECHRHLERLRQAVGLAAKVRTILDAEPPETETPDPDLMLYQGGFINDADRGILNHIHTLEPSVLANFAFTFRDARLPEMLFRYRARNYPETLNREELARWEEFRLHRLTAPNAAAGLIRADYERILSEWLARSDLENGRRRIIESLYDYLHDLLP